VGKRATEANLARLQRHVREATQYVADQARFADTLHDQYGAPEARAWLAIFRAMLAIASNDQDKEIAKLRDASRR
jgi:hypothetical protein